MALSKNILSVPFARGIETKTDDLQDQLDGVSVLENAIFQTPNKLLKRKGYNLLDTKLLDNSEITDGKYLASFRDELGLLTETKYYTYSESINKWTDKGQVFTAFPTSKTIIRNSRQQSNLDLVSVENINVYSYEDSTGVRVSLVDNANCNFLLSDFLVSASGTNAKVVNIENTVYIFYADGSDIKYRTVNVLKPNELSTETVFNGTLNTSDNNFDCVSIAARIFVTWNSNTNAISAASINSTENISSVVTLAGEDASDSISANTDCNSRLIVNYSNGTEVKVVILSFTLGTQILAPTIVETISNATNVVSIESDKSSNGYTVFYEITDASPKNHYIKKNTIDVLGTVGTPEVLKRSVGVASKPFIFKDEVYLISIHESTLQSTYILLDSEGNVKSRISENVGGKLITGNSIPKVTTQEDNKYLLATQIKGRTVVDSDQFFSLLGVNSTILDFELEDIFQNEVLGDNMHIAGGIPMMYDGDRIVEHGFHLFPEDLEDSGTITTGGSIPDGTYQYAAVYAWTDNAGQIHRSAPSIGLEVVLSGGTQTQQQSVTIPTLRLTQKSDVVIELYRTEANGTIFYKITDTQSPVINDPSVDSITIADTISNEDIISKEILYTTGGVLDNTMAPSSSVIESFRDRIFLAGLEQQNTLQYSKIRFEGAPVEFNDTLTIPVNDKGGSITALKAMDEKLIVFKETAMFYISGDGPNNLGQQDTFIKPELISSDIGCININSVVLTPQGLMFKSKKGIYLLSRGLQLTYIGASVEEFNDLRISSAIVVPEDNQVRFTTYTGESLVYNYFAGQWAAFTNHAALSAVNILFTYYYLRSDGTLYIEDETGYTDNGSPINMKVETSWISFAGVQAFQRIYKILLLGEFKSPHKIRVRIAYDFNEAFVQEVVIDTADFTSNERYGTESPYGTGTPYGGDGNVEQMRINLKRQKCQSIKIRIEEIQADEENYGEGLSLNNIMFEVGQKVGTNKLGIGKKYGTE